MLIPSWTELHAAITHFPIAMLIGGALFDVAAQVKKRRDWQIVSFWMLALAVAASVPSLITGWITGIEVYGQAAPPAIFVWHRALAFGSSAIALALLLVRWRARDYDLENPTSSTRSFVKSRTPLLILSLLVAASVGATGYFGGQMVFGDESSGNSGGDKTAAAPIEKPQKAPIAKVEKFDAILVSSGARLYVSESCASCHVMDGKGKNRGPNLTHIGSDESSVQWHIEHLENPKSKNPKSTMPAYDYLSPSQLKALATYLASRK